MDNKKPLFSFIVPVYNTGPILYETLDSINNQLVEKDLIQTIIVDDCSTQQETIDIIDKLSLTNQYKNIALTIVRNEKNLWLSKARSEGVKKAKGEYLIMLDSDDTIENDFISLSYVVFKAFPKCSWVYPSFTKFGFRNSIFISPNYSAKQLFLTNYSPVCSMMKKSLWDSLGGQKTVQLTEHVKLYEDWDFWQRAIGKGHFAAPMKKPVFNYRQNINSLVTRSEEEGNMSMLMAFRTNWKTLFGIPVSQKRYKANNKHTSNYSIIDKVFRKIIKVLTGRNPINFKLMDLMMYIFAPKYFLKSRLKTENIRTKSHAMAGFAKNFELNLSPETEVYIHKEPNIKRIIVTHFFWQLGGAENVLLEYVKIAHKAGYEVIDIVVDNIKSGDALAVEFARYSTRQYNLNDLSEFPYSKLTALWEIIKMEKADIIFNMSNPFTYLLLPEIKNHFPNIKTLDLLHAEEYENNGWFEGARPFHKYLDTRVVISDFWKKVLNEKYKEDIDKIKVVLNKVDYDKFTFNPNIRIQLRKKYGIKDNQTVIGFMGRLDKPKQPEVVVEVAKLLSHRDDLVFVIIGEGKKLRKLKPQMDKLMNVKHLNATKNPEKMFHLFDIGLFPSLFEGYPMVSLECAALNIPVIVPNIQGFREQITLGDFGKLYPVLRIANDAEAIANIIENELEEILAKGKNGRNFLTKYHNVDVISEDILNLFG